MSSAATPAAGPDRLWSVDEHLEDVLTTVHPLEPIELQLLDAQGCVLVEDVTVPVSLPPFDNSSMDGYAVRVADVAGASERFPAALEVVGDVAAGAGQGLRVGPGQAARIMTGAPLPEGAEAVVPVEWTDGGLGEGPVTGMRARSLAPEGATGHVDVYRPAQARAHVRAKGSDVKAGDRALEAGTLLGPPQIALLAAIGRATVRVHRAGSGYARGEHTRQRLLEAGIELFGEFGYERASTRAIARHAGVSLPALQYYFGGKEGLHRACAQYITEDVRTRLDPAAERVRQALGRQDLTRSELLELLRAVVEPFLEGLATDRPESWALFFARAQGEHTVAFDAIFQQIGGRLLAIVMEIVGRLLGRPAGDPDVAIRAVVIVGQLALVRRARPIILRALGWPDFEGERLRLLKETMWNGIARSLVG